MKYITKLLNSIDFILDRTRTSVCNNSKNLHTNFKEMICREQSETLSTNKGRFCNNSETDTLISKRLYVENKAKLSQLTRPDFVTKPNRHTNL